MTLEPTTLPALLDRMAALKAAGGAISTNYFRQEMAGSNLLAAATDRSVVFLNDEFDFFRLYYFTRDLADLGDVLSRLPYPGTTVCGYLTKSAPDAPTLAALQQGRLERHSHFRRMTHTKLPVRPAALTTSYAEPADADALYAELFAIFDPFSDHLPKRETFATWITQRQVLVNRRDAAITGAVVFQILGKQVNFNYLFSRSADPMDLLRLQSSFYAEMHTRGLRSGFLWVNATNTPIIRLHASFGWKFDGLEDRFHLFRPRHA